MERVVTRAGVLRRVSFNAVDGPAQRLWLASFKEDNAAFAQAYFSTYAVHVESHFMVDASGALVLMAFNTKEAYDGYGATLIEGIAVAEKHRGQGIMSAFLDLWLPELEAAYKHVFIQAYNWDIYKKYDFHEFTNNNLYAFKPSAASSQVVLAEGYLNPIDTVACRTPQHLSAYDAAMKKAGARACSHKSASLYFDGGSVASNVTFVHERDLLELLGALQTPLTFLLDEKIPLKSPAFELLETGRTETKIYRLGDKRGRFGFLF